MRANRFVAAASGLSRRAADAAVAQGRVTIDGRLLIEGMAIPERAKVELDGKPLHLPSVHTYIMLHKPVGYVSSRRKQGSDLTLYSLLPETYQTLRTVGRLDRDSSGLILLTDDGDFIQHHTHPSHNKAKLYELTLSRPLTPTDKLRLEQGVNLHDGPSRMQVLRVKDNNVVVSLGEGRNRQLRRTFGRLGYTVERLHRTQVGPYHLANLASGQYKAFTPGDKT